MKQDGQKCSLCGETIRRGEDVQYVNVKKKAAQVVPHEVLEGRAEARPRGGQ